RRPIPTSAFVVGGFALAGFGGFAVAGIAGTNQLNHLRATCVHSCDPSVVTAARQEILIGDILGYVALAAAGVTTLLVLTRPTVPADDEARLARRVAGAHRFESQREVGAHVVEEELRPARGGVVNA